MKALIKIGAKGVDVMELQARLAQLGYLSPADCDGQFGTYTDNAVRRFQKNGKLVEDGIVGPITWGRLFPEYSIAESIRRDVHESGPYLFLNVVRKYMGIHETAGPNRSPTIDKWTRELGLDPPVPWCMVGMQHCVKETCDLMKIPDLLIPNSGHVLTMWNKVPNEWRYGPMDGIAGDIFVMDLSGGNGHTGVIDSYKAGVYTTMEFNTNVAGSAEGDGGYEKKRKYNTIKGVIRLPWPTVS